MLIECIICYDCILSPSADSVIEGICATKCGHVYHDRCLSDWLQRTVECPQCRTKLGEEDCYRLFLNCEQNVKKNKQQCSRSNENMTTDQLIKSILAENGENRSRHLATIKQHKEIETRIISLAKTMVDESLKICLDVRRKLLYQYSGINEADSNKMTEKISEALDNVAAFEAKILLGDFSLTQLSERVDELQTDEERMPDPCT